MKIKTLYRNDPERGLTDPLPELGGRKFVFRIYSGDWLDPILSWGSNWFHPPYPKTVLHVNVPLPILPFIAWKWPFIDKAGYFGWKLYGVDAPAYKEWLCDPAEVYNGSQAVCLSFRPFATLR